MKHLKILIYFIIILPGSLTARENDYIPVRFEKISESLYVIFGGHGANSGLFIGENGLIVIDPKMNQRAINEFFEKTALITKIPFRYIINTHSDPDHILGNRFFPPEYVTYIAHENCRREFTEPNWDGSQSEWKSPEYAPYFPTVTFRDKLDIYSGGKKIELRYFGIGHTSGDAVIYFPDEKTAFLGDQLVLGHKPGAHPYKGGNTFENVRTLERMLSALDAEKFVNGHVSEVLDRDTVRDYIADMRRIQSNIRAKITMGYTLIEIRNDYSDRMKMFVDNVYREITEKRDHN